MAAATVERGSIFKHDKTLKAHFGEINIKKKTKYFCNIYTVYSYNQAAI